MVITSSTTTIFFPLTRAACALSTLNAPATLRRRWSAEIQIVRAEPVTDDEIDSMVDRDQLERGFRRLKPEQRAVVVLHFYLGLTAPEIADTLGIPAGTAKSRLHYATETLRAALEADARGVPVAATNGHSA